MTNKEIDKMEAGRKMDMLVAEKVMGWKRHGTDIAASNPFPYSTSISAAWEVVEKMEKDGFNFFIESCKPAYDWWAQFAPRNKDTEFHSEAPTASLAICRAALKTVML